jgi:hypothetical protein
MEGEFGEVLAIQDAQKITETGEPDEKFVSDDALQQVASDQYRWPDPGSILLPVVHDLESFLGETVLGRVDTRLIDGVLIGAGDADLPQCDARHGDLLPHYGIPIHEPPMNVGEILASVVIVEKTLENLGRAIEAKVPSPRIVLGGIGRVDILNGGPGQAIHVMTLVIAALAIKLPRGGFGQCWGGMPGSSSGQSGHFGKQGQTRMTRFAYDDYP